MAQSAEMRKLLKKWETDRSWPKRLEWMEIDGIRGWTKQRIDFNFPFVAIVGENGVGKSTVLQAAASIYKSAKPFFASDFFPDTPWEAITNAAIKCSVREGDVSTPTSVRKPSTRWRGNPERRERPVLYVDLRRSQPITAQVGYTRIAKPKFKEADRKPFEAGTLKRFSGIIGREYEGAGFSLSDADNKRWVPVAEAAGAKYSGFHQGAGETTLSDLLKIDFPKYGLILIDEIETSLHPRSQRRLIRDLADQCRVKELQVIVTTHSPYVLEELPPIGRVYVMSSAKGKSLITGVSPQFAMTQMDDETHPEGDLYVEDEEAKIMLEEIVMIGKKELVHRCCIVPYGAASVGQSLGQMAKGDRFPRPSVVFLDADQDDAPGCTLLPGDDAPERVVFNGLKRIHWVGLADRLARPHADIVDAAEKAMLLADHHDWIKHVANKLVIGGNTLWRGMCGIWADKCLAAEDRAMLVELIQDALDE